MLDTSSFKKVTKLEKKKTPNSTMINKNKKGINDVGNKKKFWEDSKVEKKLIK